ncbi:MAG: RHS repeat-associated core domain-containing protein, partial [Bacteroidota bacterium]
FHFNGKENDNETYGTGNLYDYGFRIYNPRLGKFLTVDPLTKTYPELTPYQYASNSPIAGIDLDGLEFLNNEEARIEVRNGGVYLKVSNFISTSIPQQNLDTKNWNGNIGVNIQVGEFKTPSPTLALPKDIPGSHLPDLAKGQGNTTDRLGKYGKSTTGMVNSPPLSSKGIAYAELVMLGIDLSASFANSYDYSLVTEQSKMLFTANDVLNRARKSGMVDKKYENKSDLSDLLNVIFCGESTSGNQEIQNLGLEIYKTFVQPFEIIRKSGLDGVPDAKILSTPLKTECE